MKKMKDCNETIDCSGRREFLVKTAFLAGGLLLTLGGSRSGFAVPVEDVTIPVGAESPLAKVGGSEIVDSSAGKIIIVRTGEAAFVAYSARCTHKGGIVAYDDAKKQFACPKHGSRFGSATGEVVEGPAGDPLPAYKTRAEKDAVVVKVG